MNKTKNELGITLVALVITIIILLILAGISIATLTGSGLFEKAKLAEEQSKEKQELEDATLKDYENKIAQYIDGNRDTSGSISQNTMSGEEHFTGEYYLNGKPIYEKTVKIPFANTTGDFSANHNIEKIDKIWFDSDRCIIESSTVENKSFTMPLPYLNGASYGAGLWKVDNNSIGLYTAANRYSAGWMAIITVNYTKTTDTATKEINVETLTLN